MPPCKTWTSQGSQYFCHGMVGTLIRCYLGGEGINFMRAAQELVAFHQYLIERHTSSERTQGEAAFHFLLGSLPQQYHLLGVSKSAMTISCTSSPQQKCCFLSTQWKCSPGSSSQKKQGALLSLRGAHPIPQTQKWGFVMRSWSQIPEKQKMHIKGKEHETAVDNNSAAVGFSSQLSTISPYSRTAAAQTLWQISKVFNRSCFTL